MSVHYSDDSVTVHHGNALDVLRSLPDASVDAVVTDPPYGLADHHPQAIADALSAWLSGDREHVPNGKGFMGRDWDRFVPPPAVWDECLRVLKPGGWLLAFAGSRTADLMGMSVRLAGFEIRDGIDWLYGSGFPKSLNVGDGRGTALKPAREPIVVARKPLAGTVAATVLAYGTGALNIDACRVSGVTAPRRGGDLSNRVTALEGGDRIRTDYESHTAGRWPSNVVLSHSPWCEVCECGARGPHDETPHCYAGNVDCLPGCPIAELDRQSGVLHTQDPATRYRASDPSWSPSGTPRGVHGESKQQTGGLTEAGTGASRFFPVFRYQAKAPARERPKVNGVAHPTVKPVALMRWLVRLVCPPGGTVLDPFAGSGTTAEACVVEGFRCVTLERDEAYLPLIVARLDRQAQRPLAAVNAA